MKKFISFVMAGAMVASLVPATAFAKGDVTATAKIVDALEKDKSFDGVITQAKAPELQLKVTSVDYATNSDTATMDVELTLDKAEFKMTDPQLKALVSVIDEDGKDALAGKDGTTKWEANSTGTMLKKAGKSDIKIADLTKIDTITDNEEAVEALLNKYEATLSAKSGNDIEEKMSKGLGEATIYATDGAGVVTKSLATKAEILELLADGYKFDDGSNINIETDSASIIGATTATVDAAKVPEVTVEDQVVKYYVGQLGYERGNYVEDSASVAPRLSVAVKESDKDSVTYTFTGSFKKDDKVIVNLASTMTKTSEGTKATVSVNSKMVSADDLVYASILGKGIKASVKKIVDVAEEEKIKLNSNGIKIESVVGDFKDGQEFELKLSKGFEFSKVSPTATYTFGTIDDNTVTFTYKNGGTADDEFTIKGDDIEIEATSAKSGATATLTVKAVATKAVPGSISETAVVEVAKVVDYKVSLTVDADEDVPVIYSGVNVDNDGITDDSDHLSLEVTAKESFAGAWSMRQGFDFKLPEGVYVTDVKNIDADNFYQGGKELGTGGEISNEAAWREAFFNAYQDGDHKNFEFKKRVFDDVNTNVNDNDPAELTFQLELVADPTFEGDVVLTLEGPLVETQKVTIAKFVKPYTVKAEQNDLIIDYRNTEVPTAITITEAEAGLWAKGTDAARFTFKVDKDSIIQFEKDATFEIDKDSDLEVKDTTSKDTGVVSFYVKSESDAKATVTIKDMKLFMQRNIPAGAYDLKINSSLADAYEAERLFAADHDTINSTTKEITVSTTDSAYDTDTHNKTDKECYVGDVADYSEVVKAAFINVVTSGRDNDNLFSTKVVVPVGEAYLLAGEAKVELDAPAYISAAGYTMLPVRAISKALGVNTNNVLWNAETRTVTVMYAQRIITMTVGQKTIYVNGSAIPSSAAPEIKDGRTFLPLRDLGTALGVTNVNWDAATKTATLN